MEYAEVLFEDVSPADREILVAMLSTLGFEGFHEEDSSLRAYISAATLDPDALHTLPLPQKFPFIINIVADQNWNSVWESNFDPVVVDDFCAIRASFHQKITNTAHEIIITPKMSFGTGHHATTYMMITRMKALSFANAHVMDFGTGTGVLAILAAQLHASRVVAIDNDLWSIENAKENFDINNISHIELVHADTPGHSGFFDIILANVTRNVIMEHFSHFVRQMNANGILLLSGLLEADESDITLLATNYELKNTAMLKRDKWICLEFRFTDSTPSIDE